MLPKIILVASTIFAALSVQQAECRRTVEPATSSSSFNRSQPCSIKMDQVCKESGNYSLKINASEYFYYGRMKVKVFMTQCPQYNSTSPWWYKISVTEKRRNPSPGGSGAAYLGETGIGMDTKEEPIDSIEEVDNRANPGKFKISRRQYEASLCDSESSVVFASCSPKTLDFPVQYVWTASKIYDRDDILCFRVSLKLEEDPCEQKEVCILMADLLDSNPSSNTLVLGNAYHYLSQPKFTIMGEKEEEEVGGESDVSSLNVNDESAVDFRKGGVSIPANNGCLITRDYYAKNKLPWLPECDCEGNYKRIQCDDNDDTVQCWCSTRSGSEISLTRRDLSCTDPMKFEFQC